MYIHMRVKINLKKLYLNFPTLPNHTLNKPLNLKLMLPDAFCFERSRLNKRSIVLI